MINKIISKATLAAFAIFGFSVVASATILPNTHVHTESAQMKVTVGGFFKFAGALVNQNRDFVTLNNKNIKNRRGDFWMDAEVIVKADGHFDSGCETYNYGAEVQLEANPANQLKSDVTVTLQSVGGAPAATPIQTVGTVDAGKAGFINADKVYMYVSNDCFGRVEAGSGDGAIASLFDSAYVAGFGTGGIDGIYQDFLGSSLISSPYQPKSAGRALKVYYVTPRFDGVQFAMSHAPVAGRNGRFVTRRRVALTDPGTGILADQDFENSGEYSVNYANTFCDSIGVNLSAGFSHAHPLHSVRSHEPWRAYGFAGKLSYAGFSVSGSYANNGKSGYFKGTLAQPMLSNTKERAYTAGLEYEAGSYVIGTNYASMRTAGNTTIAGHDKEDVYAGGAKWKAAPGLSLFVEGVSTRRKLKATPGVTNKSSMALLGSRVDW